MGEKQHNRFSIMNFGKQFLDQDEKQFEKNNTWVPITPEKPMPIKSNPVSDWPTNQMRRPNYQEFPAPGSDCIKEKLLHYHGLDQNLHLIEQTSQTGESKTFDCYSADRNTILNHIASSYTQGWYFENNESNSNALELLKNNSTNTVSANRNLDASINMAARNPLLPKFYPQARSDVSDYYTGVQRCNIYSASDTVFEEANRFMISNGKSEFTSSNSTSLPNNGVHCSSVPNQLECMYSESSETPYGNTYPDYDLNYVPIAEVDATASFTNFLQSISEPMDQLKFVEDQFCTIPDYTITESTSQVNDKQKNLVAATENEIQEYNNGLLQQIVDSSSAAISPTYGDQKGSDKNICGVGNDQGFDLNKTPEQKTPRRRKHRPKVIVEAKPKRNAKPATQKTQNKENSRKRKKNVPKSEETTQTGVMEETADSTVAAKKSCRKVINFDLENTEYGCESRIACQQEVHHRNEKGFNTTSDHKATEMLGRETITYGTNSALLISQNDALAVENQQPRKTHDNTHPLHEKLTNSFPSERKSTTTLSPTTEQQQIVKFSVNEKGPAQGYYDLCQEGNYRCRQQYIYANSFQPEPYFENFQKTQELICQDTLPSVPNILTNSIEAKGSKRKYRKSTESQQKSAPNPLSTSLSQEILQAGGNSKRASPAKGLLKNQKNKKTLNKFNLNVSGRSSSQLMPKENSKKASKNKDTFQPASNEKKPNSSIQSNRFVELQNAGASSGEPHQIYSTLIDEIVCQLNVLNLGEGKISEMEGQMTLVPYNGAGSIVSFQESELAKTQKRRPKVDLDQETERTWKLLMGKEASEGHEGIDKDREKWWEDERNVFHGRVDSFIARMHLILGDRRFSKWKGSVVDSVIGVFLTQNVSDHLSSSAFMSLTARFSLKSESTKRSYDVDTNKLFEAELCMVNSGNTITSYGIGTLKQPTFQLGFETPHHTRALWRGSETTRTKGSLIKANNQSSEEELLSSQDSLDSSITQDTRIRSTSASNSESEGFESRWEPRKTQFLTSTNSFLEGKATMFQDFYSSINGVSLPEERTKNGKQHQVEPVKQNCRVDRSNSQNIHSAFTHPSNFVYQPKQLPIVPSTNNEKHYPDTQGLQTFQINGGEFSWTETVSVNNKFQENSYRRYSIGIDGDTAYKPTKMLYGNETLESLEFPSVSPYEPSSQETSESENRPIIKSINTFHILGNGKDNVVNDCSNIPKYAEEGRTSEKIISAANWHGCSDNIAESEPEKPVYYPRPVDKMSKFKVPKAKKTKLETEKKHAEDWDMLRKQVRANGIQEERSTNTMDSLDYEAVRCASVKEISDTIKERGMNNMLAERIKEFLNRLVTDHGSIDLEWLRHVPPDKAKDYLLSIRGLGLKSVECVRLLTLHHMAFPVDTNVGRIAVRLGWVPLQPLPETLQIHLLELYPVLESVQKYLWPRLCKLDQRTLYELHYQMITFGKVFCTKKKPNCNACPMRAECRHFASAFASARLALPGPEEKHIVSMHVPISAEQNSSVNTIPMILPLPEYNSIREISPQTKQCEPIIEEPATPEQEWTEDLESDIEDFYREDEDEDSDGIPIIEVNIKELAMNVQNHLQEYGEHNEGDLSKALVALTTQSASIPTPKLKNVSRLRTEHQVYELPDSHPLLEKMDKREPDDPSPYLLAIWIPGETANSVEPPERRCGSEDSTNLCNDKTCFSCNSIREAKSQTVRGTILIPCRTATRGSFPLNGTYFQVNEVFADHASSIQPIDVPRAWIWNLPRRAVYFGTSVTSIFKGLSTQEIQHCFWRGFVCVRGFDQHTHAPRPLSRRLHYTANRLQKTERRKQE